MSNRKLAHWSSPLLLLAASASSTATNLPYNPTRIFLSPDDRYAYVVQPGADSSLSAQLSSIDISKSLGASDLSLATLSPSLPFLEDKTSTSYTCFIDASGNITFYAGDCSKGAEGSEVWRFQPDASLESGNGTFTKDTLSSGTVSGESMTGSNYLSSGLAFSQFVNRNLSNTGIYVLGGMCPESDANASTWTSNATYSDLMLAMTPSSATSTSADYDVALVTTQGPPIAEAGFSITGLQPAYSNSTSGVETQQQNFVLLGGHTQNAFINTSQVALFSLPQESWTFHPVTQPSAASDEVTPRSGHTAVLSEDGTRIVIYGGWVGDYNTPATPQLAVLELGAGYGGEGAWAWTVPSQTGSATFSGPGIYGHGAVMLPGNVMMVMGGYTISGTSASRLLRRSSSPTVNTQSVFYNVTSSSWISTYSTSASKTSTSEKSKSQGALATSAEKAGLGVGLTLAILAIIGVACFTWWYMRRQRRQRQKRESIQRLVGEKASPTWFGRNSLDGDATGGLWDHQNSSKEAFPWLPEVAGSGWKSQHAAAPEAERTGVFVNIPSPTRGLRKSSNARSYQYQAAPRFEDGRASRLSSTIIHPIEEKEEEESMLNANSSRPVSHDTERRFGGARDIFDPAAALRFVDIPLADGQSQPITEHQPNPLGSHPVSPELGTSPSKHESIINHSSSAFSPGKQQISNWVHEWSAQRVSPEPRSGRVSPTKSADERTSSTLSDMSARSQLSGRSVARTTSTRTNAFFGLSGTPYITPNPSPVEDRSYSFASQHGPRSPTYDLNRNRSVTAPYGAASKISHVPNISFSQLQADGETLLGSGDAAHSRANMGGTAHKRSSSQYSQATDGAPSTIAPTSSNSHRRKLGWMGSLRRALAPGMLGQGAPPPIVTEQESSIAACHDRSASSSPTKYTQGRRDPPRRTASDSSAFLRHKRGRNDWDSEGAVSAWEPYRDDPLDAGDWGEDQTTTGMNSIGNSRSNTMSTMLGGISPGFGVLGSSVSVIRESPELNAEEWDVEKAAENRDVQVMFTVPKARLRVVNADVERANSVRSGRSVSDGGKSLRGVVRPEEQRLVDINGGGSSGDETKVKDV